MPSFISAAIISATGAVGATATFITVATAVVVAVASYAISASLAPKPRAGTATPRADLNDISGQTISGADPVSPWRIAYGRTRLGGNYALKAVSYDEGVIIERHVVPVTPQYTVAVKYAPYYTSPFLVRREYVDPDPEGSGQILYETLTVKVGVPGEGEYAVSGGVFEFPASMAGQNVDIQYWAYGFGQQKFLNLVLVLCANQSEAIDEVWFDDVQLPIDGSGNVVGPYAGYVVVRKHLGTPGEPADALLREMMPLIWSHNHTLEGHTYLYLRLQKGGPGNPWESGLPNISAVGRWKNDIYDYRTSTRGYTTNWALCCGDYITHPLWGIKAPFNEDDAIAAANVSDEDVALAAGGTEKRYTINGVVNLGDQPKNILRDLVSAGAGRLIYVGGEWRLHAGVYSAPAAHFEEGDFRGPVSATPRLSRREALNTITGTYLDPNYKWQAVDVPVFSSDAAIAEDSLEVINKDVQLKYTDSAARAQRLFKIDLLRARHQRTFELPLKLVGLAVQPPDTFTLTLPKFGIDAGVFEAVELTFDMSGPAPGITLIGRQIDSSIFDWSTSEEQLPEATASTSLQNPFFIAAPGVPSVVESLVYVPSAGVKIKATVTWAPSDSNRDVRYRLEWKKRDEILWNESAGLVGTSAEIVDLEAAAYLFRVAAVNAIGAHSLWAQREKTFSGLMPAPSAVAGFSVVAFDGVVSAKWAATTDLDVRYGGSVVLRHSTMLIGAEWENGIDIGTFSGASTHGPVPAIAGTYMAKFVDSSGIYSTAAAKAVMSDGDLTALSIIASSIQTGSPSFQGAMSNVVYDAGLDGIRIDDLSTISGSATPLGEWPHVGVSVTLMSTGSYSFDAPIDLGTVATRRYEAGIEAYSYDNGDLIDSRLDLIDTWSDIDGLTINDCFAVLYISLTDDDPIGSPSPSWGPWRPFLAADFSGRAARFKIDLASASTAHNIVITTLEVHVKL